MSIKTILACLSSKEHATDVLAAAIPLARQHNAHLIGLRTPEQLVVYPSVAIYIPDAVEVGFLQAQVELSEELGTQFRTATDSEPFSADYRIAEPPKPMADRIAEAGFTTDLVVMAQDAPTHEGPDIEATEEMVIRRSGRPVLIIPKGYEPSGTLGQSVVLGWSATPEAARAIHDAMPLLAPGAKVAVITVGKPDESRAQSASDVAAMLARHGFGTEVEHRAAGKESIAGVLKREALERGADMMITGAFGHSRIYDFVVGAVTLDLMRTAKIPVLFSR